MSLCALTFVQITGLTLQSPSHLTLLLLVIYREYSLSKFAFSQQLSSSVHLIKLSSCDKILCFFQSPYSPDPVKMYQNSYIVLFMQNLEKRMPILIILRQLYFSLSFQTIFNYKNKYYFTVKSHSIFFYHTALSVRIIRC